MYEDAVSNPDTCQLPGCTQPVEQPASGGPRKRFCCDQHRMQLWRQTRAERESPRTTRPPSAPTQSPAIALRTQLEESVHSLEQLLTRARTTLLELSDLDEAEAIRDEARTAAEEQVARAHNERTAEERRRRAAESLAEAASSAAREAETETALARSAAEQASTQAHELQAQLHQAHHDARAARERETAVSAQLEQLRHELDQTRAALASAQERLFSHEGRMETELERHRAELAAANERLERTQDRLEHALTELRGETETRAKAEARAHIAEERLRELKPATKKQLRA